LVTRTGGGFLFGKGNRVFPFVVKNGKDREAKRIRQETIDRGNTGGLLKAAKDETFKYGREVWHGKRKGTVGKDQKRKKKRGKGHRNEKAPRSSGRKIKQSKNQGPSDQQHGPQIRDTALVSSQFPPSWKWELGLEHVTGIEGGCKPWVDTSAAGTEKSSPANGDVKKLKSKKRLKKACGGGQELKGRKNEHSGKFCRKRPPK